jgi:hypothetical protein
MARQRQTRISGWADLRTWSSDETKTFLRVEYNDMSFEGGQRRDEPGVAALRLHLFSCPVLKHDFVHAQVGNQLLQLRLLFT